MTSDGGIMGLHIESAPLSGRAKIMRGLLRRTLKPFLRPGIAIKFQRQYAHLACCIAPCPKSVSREAITVGGVPAIRYRPNTDGGSVPRSAVLYTHGGAFVIGSPSSYKGLCGGLAAASGSDVIALDYRLAPEHFFPSAPDDALAAYTALIDQYDAISLAGDSAGGNLALVNAMQARDAGLRTPQSVLMLSPWLDLACTGETHQTCAETDPLLNGEWVQWAAGIYAAKHRLDNPRISPLLGDLRNLPPMMIQAGTNDILYSDSTQLLALATDAGADLKVHAWNELWHVFPLAGSLVPESQSAIEQMGAFLAAPSPGAAD